ncbi:MAG: hypothetical protein ACRC57_07475 [Sarcina sp.]
MKSWIYEKENYYYILEDGSSCKDDVYYINCSYYGFDKRGKMLTGYQKIKNKYYLFKSSGAAYLGWKWNCYLEGYQYFDPNDKGSAMFGLVKIGWNYYYFDSKGIEIHDKFKIIKNKLYYFGLHGTYINSWFYEDGKTYYAGNNGSCFCNGVYEIESKKYKFNQGGQLLNRVFEN